MCNRWVFSLSDDMERSRMRLQAKVPQRSHIEAAWHEALCSVQPELTVAYKDAFVLGETTLPASERASLSSRLI